MTHSSEAVTRLLQSPSDSDIGASRLGHRFLYSEKRSLIAFDGLNSYFEPSTAVEKDWAVGADNRLHWVEWIFLIFGVVVLCSMIWQAIVYAGM
jgi:hypothetical protein